MKKIFSIALMIFMLGIAQAQVSNLSVPFSFGFEEADSLLLRNWHFNVDCDTSICKERWLVGSYVKTEGKRSLYISADEGVTSEYDTIVNTTYAYVDFTVPSGQYELSFDWRCLGGADSYLCAGIGIAGNMPNLKTDYSLRGFEKEVTQNALPEHRTMRGTSKWRNTSIPFSSNGVRVYRLYFAWCNKNTNSSLPSRIAACIDNIQVAARNCAKPSDITAQVSGDSVIVSWKGYSEQYCFEYRQYGREKWSVQTGLQTESIVLEGLDEGAYDFRVRGVCNSTDTSAYAYRNTYGVYYKDGHCINLIDLNSENIVATYGTFSNPYANIGLVDSTVTGADPKYWRHVVNWEADEFDPRTGYRLRTIPDGEVASIRLGNWNVGSEGESMSFSYVVDSEHSAILLLKYAVVLEDPNHDEASQPHFTLEILDENGYPIDPTCGAADFFADSRRDGWHNYGGVTWKDWTVLGLNLSDWDGELITVRLTTRDCDWGGHYGYAYFTVSCVAAKITSTSCGDDSQLSIAAPYGFSYQWFDKYDNVVPESLLVDKGQTILVDPSDTTTYRCHLTYLEESSCGFDLYSRCLPRFPVASFDWEYAPANCQNRVRFKNKSHIMTEYNGVKEYHYDQSCDEYDWDFAGLHHASDKNPVVIFPASGGRFAVTLSASIAEGRCVNDTTIYIDLPAISDTVIYRDTTICEGRYVMLGPLFCGMDSTYSYTWKTKSDCDSTIVLRVHLIPSDTKFGGDTTVCAESELIVDGQRYKQFPESGLFYRFYTNRLGCDSTVYMNVTVLDSIKPEVLVNDLSDGTQTGSISVSGNGYTYYEINGVRNGPLSGLTSGIYHLEFFNDYGCSVIRSIVIGYDPLSITIDSQTEVCSDELSVQVPFAVTGTPVSHLVRFHYKMWFDTKGITNGFPADTIAGDMPIDAVAFDIPLPAGAKAGYYNVYVQADNELGEPVVTSFILRLDFSAGLIFQRWGDVLSLYNQEVIGDSVIGFQWMRNGEEITGADKSYYYADGGLLTDVPYKVRLLMADSTVLYTCDVFAHADPAAVQVYPTAVGKGGSVKIRVPAAALLDCYTTQGLKVDNRQLSAGDNSWSAPSVAGVYILIITTDNDTRSFRISVRD